jgi:hypothetical protein
MRKFKASRKLSRILLLGYCEPLSRKGVKGRSASNVRPMKQGECRSGRNSKSKSKKRKEAGAAQQRVVDGWERAEQLRRFIAAYAEESRSWMTHIAMLAL